MAFCQCTKPLANTNVRGKEVTPGVVYKLWFQSLYSESGQRNSITVNNFAAENFSFDATPLTRIYPVGPFENAEIPRAERVVQTFNSGRSAPTQQGVRSFSGLLVGAGQKSVGILDTFECQDIGFYLVDSCGNLTGLGSDNDLLLYPIPIASGSLATNFQMATDTTVAAVLLTFQVDQTMNDADLRVVPAAYLATLSTLFDNVLNVQVPVTRIKGLTDVDILSNLPPSATSMTVRVNTDGGQINQYSLLTGVPVTGLTTANFRVLNLTDGTELTPSAVTETANGTYALTYASQTVGDILAVRVTTDYLLGSSGFYGQKTIGPVA
jgi:hypothetical protein